MAVTRSKNIPLVGAVVQTATPLSPGSGFNNLKGPISVGAGGSVQGQTSYASQYKTAIITTFVANAAGAPAGVAMDVQTSSDGAGWTSILAAPVAYATNGLKRETVTDFGTFLRVVYASNGGAGTADVEGGVDLKE